MAERPDQRKPLSERAREFIDVWVDVFGRHQILAHASAVAFRTFVALIPLLLLGFAVLGAIHRTDVWTNQLSPSVATKVTLPVFAAIDSTANRIFTHDSGALITFAAALTMWNVSSAVRACMGGMNAIYETDENRPMWRRFGVSFALALAISAAFVGATLLVTAAKGWGGFGIAVARWLLAVVVIAAVVNLLIRYAPAESRPARWDSAGALLVVVVWVGATLLFALFVAHVASFRSAIGVLAAFLVLTTYVYVSSIVFLVGVQLDELLRADAEEGERGIVALILDR